MTLVGSLHLCGSASLEAVWLGIEIPLWSPGQTLVCDFLSCFYLRCLCSCETPVAFLVATYEVEADWPHPCHSIHCGVSVVGVVEAGSHPMRLWHLFAGGLAHLVHWNSSSL